MIRPAAYFFSVIVIVAGSGCQYVRMEVDCRLSGDSTLWPRLEGPRYVIQGVDEQVEASLAFKEFAAMLERALRASQPELNLQRIDNAERADLFITMDYTVIDRGSGTVSYPVYGRTFAYTHMYGGYPYHGSHYGAVGTGAETYHRGYARTLFISAWIPDASQPAERQVIWEGACDSVGQERSLKIVMPYLMVALAPYYGQATDRPEVVRIKPDDDRVEMLWRDLVAD